ncbi:MAG: nucleotide exchange factor GrpE [Gammaproteobacteria bacterium]
MSKKSESDTEEIKPQAETENGVAENEAETEAEAEAGEGSEQAEAGAGPDVEQLMEKIAEVELAAATAKDDLLRVKAEMQNLRRRTEQDIEKAHKYGQEKFSIELLSVMDNLERALEAASEHDNETVKAIYDGVELTRKSFIDCFNKFNIEAVDPLGEPFDPELHQAMSTQENNEVEPNTVVAVMQKGYTLHGRVIRPAMVMVSKPAST